MPDGASTRLTVLPNSGKVDQLRAETRSAPLVALSPESAPTTAPHMPDDASLSPQQRQVRNKVIDVLRSVYDPEIPVSIYELGLIYSIDVAADGSVHVRMTLTAPACPVAGSLPGEVERRIETIDEVPSAKVELVWDPPWSRQRMSEAALLELGLL